MSASGNKLGPEVFEAMLVAMSEGVYGLDDRGRCIFINPSALRLLGYTREECLERDLHELIHGRYPMGAPYPREDCPIIQALQRGETLRQKETVLWHRDGSPVPVIASAAPFVQDGQVCGLVVSIVDVSAEAQERIGEAGSRINDVIADLHRQSRF